MFRLDVTRHLEDWKKKGERERRWLPLAEAAALAEDGDLGEFWHYSTSRSLNSNMLTLRLFTALTDAIARLPGNA